MEVLGAFTYHVLCNAICVGNVTNQLPNTFFLRLRLTGYSDWGSESIDVFINEETATVLTTKGDAHQEEILRTRLHTALTEHLSAIVGHVFLGRKPARPAQSRWTGVADVCQWCLGLSLFHKLFKPLLGALSSKSDDLAGNEQPVMDNDVRDSDYD